MARTLQVVALRNGPQVVRELDIVLGVDIRRRRHEREHLRLARRCELDSRERAEDVGGTQLLIRVHPVDLQSAGL